MERRVTAYRQQSPLASMPRYLRNRRPAIGREDLIKEPLVTARRE
jgi:hypothetical protein